MELVFCIILWNSLFGWMLATPYRHFRACDSKYAEIGKYMVLADCPFYTKNERVSQNLMESKDYSGVHSNLLVCCPLERFTGQPNVFQPSLPEPNSSQPSLSEPKLPLLTSFGPNLLQSEPNIPQPSIPEPNYPPLTLPEPNIPQPEPKMPQPSLPELYITQPSLPEPNPYQPSLPVSNIPQSEPNMPLPGLPEPNPYQPSLPVPDLPLPEPNMPQPGLPEPNPYQPSLPVPDLPLPEPNVSKPRSSLAETNLPEPPFCGLTLTDRIYGGNRTLIDEYPWTVRLQYSTSEGKGFFCGGSLISSRWVITAAHCVSGRALQRGWRVVGVRLGEWNTETNPDCVVQLNGHRDCAPEHIDVPVDRLLTHPLFDSYNPNVPNDIALLRLAQPVHFSNFVKPICLPQGALLSVRNFAGTTAIVSGWGRTENMDKPSLIKLQAFVNVTTPEDCREIYKTYNITLSADQICAGGQLGVDSCRGDSGGPLMVELPRSGFAVVHYLAGLVSLGRLNCATGTPGIYTRIGGYLDWIRTTIYANP